MGCECKPGSVLDKAVTTDDLPAGNRVERGRVKTMGERMRVEYTYYDFSNGRPSKKEVRFHYRGPDMGLFGCQAADLKVNQGGPFKVSGTAVKLDGCRVFVVRRIFYASWVGFLKDWVVEWEL